MPSRKCIIKGCLNKKRDAIMHNFPVNDRRKLSKWLDCINYDYLRTYSMIKLRILVVCQNHFENRFIMPSKLRLKRGAYPTLFTPEEIATGLPSKTFEDIVYPEYSNDHNYCSRDDLLPDHNYCSRDEPEDIVPISEDCSSATENTPAAENLLATEKLSENKKATVIIMKNRSIEEMSKLDLKDKCVIVVSANEFTLNLEV